MPGITSTALPSFSHDQHHTTDAAKRKAGLHKERSHEVAVVVVIVVVVVVVVVVIGSGSGGSSSQIITTNKPTPSFLQA